MEVKIEELLSKSGKILEIPVGNSNKKAVNDLTSLTALGFIPSIYISVLRTSEIFV